MSDDNKEPKKGANRLKKEAIVEEIKLQLDTATSIVLTDYQGLTHRQLEEMKKQLKTVNSTFAITKNTLLKISLSASKNFADRVSPEALNAPTATLFIAGDPIEALKILQKVAKDTGFPKIKVGVIDGESLGQEQLIKLSTLPNKATLLAQFVGTLNSPIQGLVVVLNGNLQKLVMVLNAIAQNKPATPAPAAETPAQPVEAAPVEAQAQTTEAPTTEEKVSEEAKTENNEEKSEGGENSNGKTQ